MKKAFLYIRVSTDEQADKGYSQRHQAEMLQRYCSIQGISIVATYYEDYSGKSFARPEFTKMLITLKKHKGIANLLLCTKWDRFSRNTGESYSMIATLLKAGVVTQAVEQPLDLSVPENKLMMALYLATPEVENDRRALNVTVGMRRAGKEGRWMNGAPIGYVNRTTPEGRKYIAISHPNEATIIQKLFEGVAAGTFSVESLIRLAQAKGLQCSRNNFHFLLRNPVYCGQIRIKAWKDEPEQVVEGQHEAIISKALFYQVQDVLNGKARPQARLDEDDRFPLRGHLLCPECNRVLTASASRGRTRYYTYYHCSGTCKVRYQEAKVNEVLKLHLASLRPHPAVVELYQAVLQEVLGQGEQERRRNVEIARKAVADLATRQKKGLELLMAGSIGADDYATIKQECDSKTAQLEGQITDWTASTYDISADVEEALSLLSNLATLYTTASTASKRKLLGSIFPEKLVFCGDHVRTTRMNEVVALLFNLGAGLEQKETPLEGGVSEFVSQVTRPGFEPRQAEPESAVLPLYYRAI